MRVNVTVTTVIVHMLMLLHQTMFMLPHQTSVLHPIHIQEIMLIMTEEALCLCSHSTAELVITTARWNR